MSDFKTREQFIIELPLLEVNANSLKITCNYSCDGVLNFKESFEFDFPGTLEVIESNLLSKAAEMVAIAAAPSYYKATIAEEIEFEFPITLQTKLWAQGLFDEGLREFRFRNELELAKIPFLAAEQVLSESKESRREELRSFVVPIGGGKDSATTLKIIESFSNEIVGFSVGDFEPINNCAKVAGVELIKVTRAIDPRLLELNEQGAPNGHVPVTALTSMLANIAAIAIDYDSVVMSNEASADEPTRTIKGIEVNHQWSKSGKAEKLLREALESNGIAVEYFSALRAMSEFQIFEMFSGFDEYHKVFTSCNRSFHIDENKRKNTWCCDCDKCRFVFLGLCAFRGDEYAAKVFGSNMLYDEKQVEGFLDLLGINDRKPFECVGTAKESRLLARNCLFWDSASSSPVGIKFAEELSALNRLVEKMPTEKSSNFVPSSIEKVIKDIRINHFSEHLSNHIKDKSIALVGLGRDTSAIVRFLSKFGSKKSIEVFIPSKENIKQQDFSEMLDSNGLDASDFDFQIRKSSSDIEADIVFVSPGVSRYSDHVKLLGDRATTPLAWWLEYMKTHFPEKCFIGITGTKGKSTTSSLLAHVLDNSLVAGNLGNAVGDIPLDQIIASDYIILEISSYQSSYVVTPPDVVAVTSLFDCHIDWHLTPENYRRDKLNIALRGPAEIIASDSIAEFAPSLIRMRDEMGYPHVVDVITLVGSANKSLLDRNKDLVREIAGIVAPQLSDENVEARISTFKELKHRQEIIAEKNGVKYVSDVLSTAPFATLASVDDFILRFPEARIYLLCGGAYSEVDLDELAAGLNERKEKVVTVALPETGHMIADKLENYKICDELADGVQYSAAAAQPGDIVLLAPGAPSFHRYKNYEELAAHFKSLVDAL